MNQLSYRLLSKWFVTTEFVKRIEKKMKILYPSDVRTIQKKTSQVINRLIICSICAAVGLFFLGDLTVYYLLLVIGIIYILITNMIYENFYKIETRLLRSFEKFITDVRYQFQLDDIVDTAIQDVINISDYDMTIHGQQLLEYLNRDPEVIGEESYKEVSPNDYFLTFYTLCETITFFGDKVIDGQSVFLKNIGYLKQDINMEILKRQKTQASFMGLKALCVVPVFAIKPIELWAVSNMPELSSFYSGVKGSVITVIVTLISMLMYVLVNRLKFPQSFNDRKGKWIEQILKVDRIQTIVMAHISRHYNHYFKMDRLLKSVVFQYNVKEFLVKRIFISIASSIICFIFTCSTGLLTYSRISGVVSFFIIVFTGIGVYMYFYGMLILKKQMMRLERENEIVRYQTVLLIVMHMEKITIEQILNWLEEFAVVFKSDIEMMNDQMCYSGINVFSMAKADIGFIPFERLLDSFIASDRIGIEKAFEEVESDRQFYVDKHRQENEIILTNRSLIAKTIAFVPMCMIIAFELIIPFVFEGLKQLQTFQIGI